MTIKRLILIVLTFVAVTKVVLSLLGSFSEPQVQSRLELYQTNLILHVSEFKADELDSSSSDVTTALQALIGEDPYLIAQKQYQKAREEAENNRSLLQARLQQLLSSAIASQETDPSVLKTDSLLRGQLEQEIAKVLQFIDKLDLNLGILQAQRQEIDTAIKTWDDLIARVPGGARQAITETAAVLKGLWSQPPRLLPEAESQIQQNLDGWFRYRALKRLYRVQDRQDELLSLQTREEEIAGQSLVKLLLIGGIPFLGGMIGVGLLIFLLAQFFLKGERSLLAANGGLAWETPWNGEIVWQVLIVGFFFVGQILLPLLFGLLGLNLLGLSLRLKAVYVLSSYLLMAVGGLLVLYFSVKPFLPLPKGWFRFQWRGNWLAWGIGGYFVALPLVLVVSLINQQLWQGQGGSNPLLFLALQGQDRVALAIFFLTASVAAPIFEETIFRGFLLPSLTRYLPVWGAIVTSSLIFSIAHLSLAEVLPLTTLGIVLGFVYTRSRNLLASILLHSLWNSGTLLSLIVLGSG